MIFQKIGWLCLALLFFSFSPNEPKSRIRKYGMKDGLSHSVINSMTQDKKGLMWFATNDGLNRFDGYSFKVFKYDPDQPSSLADNFVQRVFKDSKGLIWISSRKGLSQFDEKTERFIHYRHQAGNRASLAGNDISYITESSNGNLWIASYESGISYLDKKTGQFISYTPQNLPGLTSLRIICLYEDSAGLLWVGTQDGGLSVFKVSTNGVLIKKIETLSLKNKLPSPHIKCFYEDHYKNMWIGTTQGLVLYKRQENDFFVFNTTNAVFKGNHVLSLLEDSRENLWVGILEGGLYRLDLRQFNNRNVEGFIFDAIRKEEEYDISHRSIQSLYEDRDKNLWVGTYGAGIHMISSLKENFIKIQKKRTEDPVESYVRYYGMCVDQEGNLWLGTDGDGLYQTNNRGDVIRHYTADGKKGSIPENAILSAFRDHSNTLWFGTYSQGLFRYDKSTDSFIQYRHDPANPQSLSGNDVRVIYEDAKRNLWIGTNGGGLCMLDKGRQTFINYQPANSPLIASDIRAIADDKQGGLWLGTYGKGLIHFSVAEQRFTPYFNRDEDQTTLSSGVIFALCLDRKGRLWIGMEGGGLAVYDTARKTLRRFSEKNGLANNTVNALLTDPSDHLWLSTNKGLSKFDPGTERFHNYNSSDGLQGGQFNPGSALYNEVSGYMSFGGTEGLNIFYPNQVTPCLHKPTVLITGLQLFNKTVEVNSREPGTLRLDRVIGEQQEITLRNDQSVFSFEFTALNYTYPEKNQYAYTLEGLDHDWNYVGSERTATYRYLAPGKYTFKVKATNDTHAWNTEYASIQVNILPPIWRTTYAYMLYLAIFTSISYGVYTYRRKQIRLQKRLMLEKNQRKKEQQLVKEKFNFFTEVSHEFRTPLTLMLGPLEEMMGQEGQASPQGKKLKLVYRNANKLLNLINKLLDYRKIESGKVVMKVKEDNLVAFTEEIYLTFKESAQKKNITLNFEAEEANLMVWFDHEKMEMVINNILSNSFKYLGGGNYISIRLEQGIPHEVYPSGYAVVQIADNGIGIPQKQLKYIFDWFYQADNASPMSSGIGLALAKKLVELHKGQIRVESTEGKGSVFRVELPLGKEHFDGHDILPVEACASRVTDETPFEVQLAESEEKLPQKRRKKVLIVEDEEEIRTFLKEYLEKSFQPLEATNGKEALGIALAHHPDAIIADIMMPVMNGIDLCRELKSNLRTSHIPIILLTARTALTHHKEGLEMGADAYLTKPFSPELLTITIHNLLQSRENLKRFYRHLFPIQEPVKPPLSTPDEKFLEKIFEILKSNLDNAEFNVNELCEHLHVSRSLLYKKVKALTGLSPVEYLRSLRLQEAARLLQSKQYKVFEVVYMVGFTDIKYFRQSFINEFGHPPSEYIRNRQENPLLK
jgi:ligand-binding sensor domain-containing protein/signal transduction histidine kinase/DNA-binding response OmpR family regulator